MRGSQSARVKELGNERGSLLQSLSGEQWFCRPGSLPQAWTILVPRAHTHYLISSPEPPEEAGTIINKLHFVKRKNWDFAQSLLAVRDRLRAPSVLRDFQAHVTAGALVYDHEDLASC